MQTWEIVAIVSLFFSLPVLLSAYYQLFLFISSLRYPHNLEKELPELYSYPSVSILIAVFNEKNVIEKSLMAISKLDYPPEKLQVVVADDSIDDTVGIIDRVVYNLNVLGIKADISRRRSRENFKSGALNKAMELVTGEYVLLLDADSTVQPEIIKKGIHAIQTHEGTSFVSFRVGHYNRYSNFITRLFALSQDLGDTVSKMGSYRVNMPYSFQGGFTLLRTQTVRDVGLWSTNTITEDADLSWKLYLAGTRGIYLSNVRIMSEDPSTLETWKKQTARVQQGWSKLEIDNFKRTLKSKHLSASKKIAILLVFISPFSNVSWIITTFISAFSLLFGWGSPSTSIFNSPIYIALVSVPVVIFYLSGIYALKVQRILTLQNLVFVPILSYTTACMVTRSAIAFVEGIFGKRGDFFRTPKRGGTDLQKSENYYKEIKLDKRSAIEAAFSAVGLVLGLYVLIDGVWILALSMIGFSILTLKSLNLSKIFEKRRENKVSESDINVSSTEKLNTFYQISTPSEMVSEQHYETDSTLFINGKKP